jgi:hypothetical protein
MKRALIVIALIIVLCSMSISAVPFKLVVGKQGSTGLDNHYEVPFNGVLHFPNSVFIDIVNMEAFRMYNRCHGRWFVDAFDSGTLVERSSSRDICTSSDYIDVGCWRSVNLNLAEADKVVIKSVDLRPDCSRGNCHPVIRGNIGFIEGKQIRSTITSKSGIVNLGTISNALTDFVFTEVKTGDFVVKSDNPRVMVWLGTNAPSTTVTTSDAGQDVWACYDGDLNKKCDYNEDTDCLSAYGDYYKGVCCGIDVTDCAYVSQINNQIIDAFCTQLSNGEFAWVAKENFGEIFDLDSSYCPADSLVSDGNKFFSPSKVFEYKILYPPEFSMMDTPSCEAGFNELAFFTPTSGLTAMQIMSGKKVRICGREKTLVNQSINVPSRYGTHEYIPSAGNLFECAADFPFSTNNYAELGENTQDLSGKVCPESAIFYYPLESDANNELNQFINGVTNSISFTTGKIGNAAVFSSPTSDIEIAPDQINLNLDEFSFSAWIKPSNTQGKHIIFNSELTVELYIEDDKLKASLYTEENTNGVFLSPTSTIPANQWSFVVLTYDGDKLKLFVDGTELSYADASGKVNAGTESFIIGARSFAPNEPFEGLIDEVVVYSRALPESEIQNYVSHLTSYCYLSNFTEIFYCASDGDWTKDLDVKDSSSCHAAGFDWTGHKCCSEADDPAESYSDYSTEARSMDSLITEQLNAQRISDNEILLEDESSIVSIKGPSRIIIERSYWRSERGEIISCQDKEDVLTSFDLTEVQVKRIENRFYPGEPHCKIGKTKVILLPITATGGCFDKTFYPSGTLLHKNIINYQGAFTACKSIPAEYASYDFIDIKDNHCGQPLTNIIFDKHAVCLPDGEWALIDDPNMTVVDDTLWDPVILNVPNAHKQGCCPITKCWNGTGCQVINTFYRVNNQGFVCK